MREQVVINAVPLIGELVAPAMMQVSRMIPQLELVYRSEMGLVDLSDGKTIAVRAGPEPCATRHAVRWLGRLGVALVATRDYVNRMGTPRCPRDLADHLLVASDVGDDSAPWFRWLRANTTSHHVVFRTNDETVLRRAINSGRCAGFMPISSLIWSPDLIELMPAQDEWAAPLWLVHDRGATDTCRNVGRELAAIVVRQLS